MNYKYGLFIILALVGSLGNLRAVTPLSLDSCLTMAVENNTSLKNANLEEKAAHQTRNAVVSKYFPSIEAAAGAFHSNQPFISYGISDINNSAVRNTLQSLYYGYGQTLGLPQNVSFLEHGAVAGITAIQPIYAGGRIVTGNRLANLGIQAATYQRQLAEQQIRLSVEESYWNIKLLEEKRNTLLLALDFIGNLQKDVNVALAAGIVSRTDSLRVNLKANSMQALLIQLDNGIALSKQALCQQIGLETDSLALTDSIPQVRSPWNLRMDETEAVATRTESKLLDLQLSSARLEQRMIAGNSLPQIGIGACYSYNNLMEKNYTNLTGFATLSLPITGWWETGHQLKKQAYKVQEAENTQHDLQEKMALQTTKVYNELDALYRQYQLAVDATKGAWENLRLSSDYYNAGLVSLSDLLEAQTLYQDACNNQSSQAVAYRMCLQHYLQITGR